MAKPIIYLKRDRIDNIPDLSPMIPGVLDKGTVSMLVAEPAAGKSFLAIDWAACYAAGVPWQGREIDNVVTYPDDRPARGIAMYVAGEGARGLKRRLKAWETGRKTEIPKDQFVVVPQPIQFKDEDQLSMFCEDLSRSSTGLVVIDTLARCSLGLEENNAAEMGRVIEAAYQIRGALGPDGTVLLVHHAGKNGTIRGSSALMGGVDQVLRLSRDGNNLELKDEKRKDGVELAPVSLRLARVEKSLVVESGTPQHGSALVRMMQNEIANLLPMSRTELMKATGLSEGELYPQLNRGISDGLIRQTNERNPRYFLRNNTGQTTNETNNNHMKGRTYLSR